MVGLAPRGELHRDRELQPPSSLVVPDDPVEGRPDPSLHLVRLAKDERRRPDGAAQESAPERVRRGLGVREGKGGDRDVLESLTAEEAGELLLVREPEEGRPGRDVLGRAGPRSRHRVEEHAKETRVLGQVPDRQRDAPAGGKYAGHLRGRPLRAAEVQHDEVPHHRVERPVGKRERLGVAHAKLDLRMEPAGEGDHRLGDVHTHHVGAPLGRSGRDVARAAGYVENAGAVTDPGGVEQGLHGPNRDPAEEVLVAAGPCLPARRLERVEGVGVDGAVSSSRAGSPGRRSARPRPSVPSGAFRRSPSSSTASG